MTIERAPSRPWRRRAATLALALAAVSGCGGGDQVEEFEPQRVLAMGDELSAITSDGRKYSVNALTTAKALDCATFPIWVQYLAGDFGLVFPECNVNNVASPTSRILATPGAKVADLKAQIDQFLTSGTFAEKDLVTMLVGVNDVLELYAQYPARSEADLMADIEARGTLWGQQINRVAMLGPAVLVATLPDVSLSPYALAEKAAHTDIDRAALLRRLVDAYDNAMRLEIVNDGRMIGLIFGDIEVQNIAKFPGSYGFANINTAVCASTAALPDCNIDTLVTDGSASTWLWADATRLAPGFQLRLGQIALNRARNSPF